MKTMHQKYHLKPLTSLISVGPSSFSSMILAAILDHKIITDHVDCGLMLFVPLKKKKKHGGSRLALTPLRTFVLIVYAYPYLD